tara:strand:+ start:105 stop:869 length:765 start_codon:yes stop_codon:yes gene_type:complete
MIKIEIVPVLSDNYVYIIHNEKNSKTAVIDPGDPKPIIKRLKEKHWNLDEIINTHHHYDHIAGNNELIDLWGSKLIAPLYDKEKINKVEQYVSDGDMINIVGINTQVISTPGHTLGHVCYYLKNEEILFSGDTLFRLGCGRVFEGTMEQMKNSLKKLKDLPDNTNVFCGHEYTLSNAKFCIYLQPNNVHIKKKYDQIFKLRKNGDFTIPFKLGEEKKLNPFLQCDNKDFKKSLGLENKNQTETFQYLRNKKDTF